MKESPRDAGNWQLQLEDRKSAEIINDSYVDRQGNLHSATVILDPRESLEPGDKEILVDELTPVTGRGFLRYNMTAESLREDVKNHVIDCDRLIILRDENDDVSCFVAASIKEFEGDTIYHLEGIIVEPQYQRSGIAQAILSDEIEATNSTILAFHTQSIKMVKLGNRLAVLDRREAIRLADVIGTRDQSGARDVQRYGGSPLYEDEIFAKIAVNSLDWRHGDALICAGRVRT